MGEWPSKACVGIDIPLQPNVRKSRSCGRIDSAPILSVPRPRSEEDTRRAGHFADATCNGTAVFSLFGSLGERRACVALGPKKPFIPIRRRRRAVAEPSSHGDLLNCQTGLPVYVAVSIDNQLSWLYSVYRAGNLDD